MNLKDINRRQLLYWRFDESLIGKKISIEKSFELAYSVAHRGVGAVSPNPLVGCVILDRNQELIGIGAHQRLGQHHAEVHALNDVKSRGNEARLEGADVIVTLEPCAHEGRTPSCAKLLASLPIASITAACMDPDPRTSGKGFEILERAGKKTKFEARFAAVCRELTEAFHIQKTKYRPMVALKIASDLNGVIAHQGDQRKWITNEESREYGHFLRRYYDAILVGAQTALLDNPTLDCRIQNFEKQPLRVILDQRNSLMNNPTFLNSNLMKNSDRTVVIQNGLSPSELLKQLQEKHQVQSLLVEGGAKTWATFLNARLVDKIHHFVAPSASTGTHPIYWNQYVKTTIQSEKTREIELSGDRLYEYNLS